MSKDEEYKHLTLPLTGRWKPAIDGTQMDVGDFQTLKNMRYGEVTPHSVSGMTKINPDVMNASYLLPRAGIQFIERLPVAITPQQAPPYIPPTPPPSPPVPIPSGTFMAWGTAITGVVPGVGGTLIYNFTVPTLRTSMSVDAYTIDATSEGTSTFYFPDGRTLTQSYHYGINAGFQVRSQLSSFPTIPDQYLPSGTYALVLLGSGLGRLDIRASFCI